jgi:hypothetical protein
MVYLESIHEAYDPDGNANDGDAEEDEDNLLGKTSHT